MTPIFALEPDKVGLSRFLAERKRLGHDRYDEVWNGVLHMSPAPHFDHQDVVRQLLFAFEMQSRRYAATRVMPPINYREPGTAEENYRIPDIVAIPLDRLDGVRGGWLEGGASFVVEVRSPREEVERKLEFYAAREVGEVLYVDRDTLRFEVLRLTGGRYTMLSPDREGFCEVLALSLRIRRVEKEGEKPRLEIEDARGGGPLPGVSK